MVDSLDNQNQKQKMISGSTKASPQKARSASSDLFVANVAEKRYLWTARAFSVIAAVSICCNIILFIAVSKVVPLSRVEPFLLTFQDIDEQVLNVIPVNGDLKEHKAISEALIRQYVLLRSSFIRDTVELEARWMPGGPVQEMSTPTVYADFLEKTATPALEMIKTKGLTRDVRLLSVNELGPGLWQVEYEARDYFPSSTKPDVKYFTASIMMDYIPRPVQYKERLKNPLGFEIIRYAIQQNKVD